MTAHPFPPDLGGLAPASSTARPDPRVEDLRVKLRRMTVYLDQILDDRIPATNPDRGSRCVRVTLDGHYACCRGCPLGPGGHLESRRNAICRWREAATKVHVEMERLLGRDDAARELEADLTPPPAGWQHTVPSDRLALFGLADPATVPDGPVRDVRDAAGKPPDAARSSPDPVPGPSAVAIGPQTGGGAKG